MRVRSSDVRSLLSGARVRFLHIPLLVVLLVVAVMSAACAQGWRSVQGVPLGVRSFGDGAQRVLVIGGVHGDERAALQFASVLEDSLAAMASRLHCRVYWVRTLNPDGIARGTRGNARGIDLNRNFPTKDFGTKERASRYHGGTTGGSEPETRLVMTLVDSLHVTMIITLHAPLACVNHDGPAETHARRLAALMRLPHRSDIGYATPGSLGTWAGRERGIPILTVELPARVTPRSLRSHASALVTFLRELG